MPAVNANSAIPACQQTGSRLPTLQMNALRKLLSRPEFTPEEVAALGYQRLRKAEGIGSKGLVNIIEWLAAHGLQLAGGVAESGKSPRQKKLEQALALVQSHGYEVVGKQQ